MSDKQFIKIYDWMYDLDLNKTEFLVFALIYSLTESTGGCLGQKYIQDRLHISKRWAINSIVRLREKGYIKTESTGNCYRPKRYVAVVNSSSVLNCSAVLHSSSPTEVNSSTPTEVNSSTPHLYIDKNTYKNTYKNTTRDFSSIFSELGIQNDPELVVAVDAFVEHRKKLKKPLTDRALKLNLRKARDLTNNEVNGIIYLLETAVERGWQGIYMPKEKEVTQVDQESIDHFFDDVI